MDAGCVETDGKLSRIDTDDKLRRKIVDPSNCLKSVWLRYVFLKKSESVWQISQIFSNKLLTDAKPSDVSSDDASTRITISELMTLGGTSKGNSKQIIGIFISELMITDLPMMML